MTISLTDLISTGKEEERLMYQQLQSASQKQVSWHSPLARNLYNPINHRLQLSLDSPFYPPQCYPIYWRCISDSRRRAAFGRSVSLARRGGANLGRLSRHQRGDRGRHESPETLAAARAEFRRPAHLGGLWTRRDALRSRQDFRPPPQPLLANASR